MSRILFALADVEYEDKRVMGDSWTAFKPGAQRSSLSTYMVIGRSKAEEKQVLMTVTPVNNNGLLQLFHPPPKCSLVQRVICNNGRNVCVYCENCYMESSSVLYY